MPNWTRNKLILGSAEKLDEVVKFHCPIDKETGFPEMDFNTINRMPKELDIEYGTRSHDGLSLYLARRNPQIDFYGSEEDKMSQEEYDKLWSLISDHMWLENDLQLTPDRLDLIKNKYKQEGELAKLEKLGEQCVDNIRKYGAMNWYEWSIANWGTKWNATETEIDEQEHSLTFDTAWDPAIPAMVEMSKLHPNIPMALLFADEQTGAHTGYVLFKNGSIDESGSFKDFSIDAYKLAFNVWGNAEDYKYDEKKKTYVSVFDE